MAQKMRNYKNTNDIKIGTKEHKIVQFADVYSLSMKVAPPIILKEVQSNLNKYLWKGGIPKAKHSTMIGEPMKGGLNAMDVNTMVKA